MSVEPALSAEGWEDYNAKVRFDGQTVESDCCWCPLGSRHEVAARCLDGQDFGFTRAMVEAVEFLTGHEGVTNGRGDVYLCTWIPEEQYALLRAIADRLEALLRPENVSRETMERDDG